jgi:UDP-N-acetylglucosamine--N-acetylmuramyl-(pentapeptide) pyrophosphoryl-undecaprenol N-acetylglucosamine transferase
MSFERTIVFAGGGSGGHLYPALAVIEELRRVRPEVRCVFWCSSRGIDRQILESAALRIPGLNWEPLFPVPRGRSWFRRLTSGSAFAVGFVRASRRLRLLRPDLVVGLGAFASVSGVFAAVQRGIGVALLESNTIPGRATQMLARHARRIFTGLPLEPEWSSQLGELADEVGVPVRADFAELTRRPAAAGHARRVLLILGGSQGASRLNELVCCAFSQRGVLAEGWRVLHQTGERDLLKVRSCYEGLGLAAEAVAFLPDLPVRLGEAGLVISRAGAVTLAELACASVPSILVPLSSAAVDHQRKNAMRFVKAGAASLVEEQQADAVWQLQRLVGELTAESGRRWEMAACSGMLARPNAAGVVARSLLELVD